MQTSGPVPEGIVGAVEAIKASLRSTTFLLAVLQFMNCPLTFVPHYQGPCDKYTVARRWWGSLDAADSVSVGCVDCCATASILEYDVYLCLSVECILYDLCFLHISPVEAVPGCVRR